MKEYDATEQAYKNGFEAGRASVIKYGQWKTMWDPHGRLEGWIHNECGRITLEASNYCPLCGAKMSLEE